MLQRCRDLIRGSNQYLQFGRVESMKVLERDIKAMGQLRVQKGSGKGIGSIAEDLISMQLENLKAVPILNGGPRWESKNENQ